MADQEGYGFLYPKKNREGSQPHLTGKVTINGRVVELAAWKKTSSKGNVPYLSVAAQDKGPAETTAESQQTAMTQGGEATEEDPIPF